MSLQHNLRNLMSHTTDNAELEVENARLSKEVEDLEEDVREAEVADPDYDADLYEDLKELVERMAAEVNAGRNPLADPLVQSIFIEAHERITRNT